MEKLSETVKDTPKETISFFNHVFNFDDDNKNEMLKYGTEMLVGSIWIVLG